MLKATKGKSFMAKAVLLIFGTVSHMCTGLIAPAVPKILHHYADIENIDFLVKILVTTPHFFIAILSPIVGIFVFKINRKLFLIFALVVYAIDGLVCFFIDSIYVMIACRAVLGAAIALIITIVTSLIADSFDGQERSMMIGLQTTFVSMGTICFGLMSGIVSDMEWRYIFLFYVIPSILIPFAAVFLADPRKRDQSVADHCGGNEGISHVDVQNSPIIWMVYIVSMMHIMVYYLIPLQLPIVLDGMNVNSKYISYVIASETFVIAMVAARYRRVKKDRDHSLICFISLSIMSFAFFLISMSCNYEQILCSCLIYGIGMGLMMPNSTLWIISTVRHKNRGIAIGCFTTAIYLGKFFSAIFVHFLLKFLTSKSAYAAGALIMLIMAILVILTERLLKNKLGNK